MHEEGGGGREGRGIGGCGDGGGGGVGGEGGMLVKWLQRFNTLDLHLTIFGHVLGQFRIVYHMCSGGFFLACKDFERMFDHSFPAWASCFF